MTSPARSLPPLGWLGILRLGLVQAALGAVVVMTTSVMNRVMVVELALPALLPGALVAWHYLVQVLRPRLGHGSDIGGRRTPWILGGMVLLGLGGVGAACSVALMASELWAGIALAVIAFTALGLGVGAAGTSLLVLLSNRVAVERRPAAATIVWLMMFAGFVITTIGAGSLLTPYSAPRLIAVSALVSVLAVLIAVFAVRGMEGEAAPATIYAQQTSFLKGLQDVWRERQSRRFAAFVFVAMLAYSAQELILDPFAGEVMGLTPGQSTQLSGVQHGGALLGMILVAIASQALRQRHMLARFAQMRLWTMGGCAASAAAALILASAALVGPSFPWRETVFALGIANGAFSAAAIGAMMQMVATGCAGREGVRMGLWGAAQAVAFGCGGLFATGLSDLAHHLLSSQAQAYGVVFAAEACVFLFAATLAASVFATPTSPASSRPTWAAPTPWQTKGSI